MITQEKINRIITEYNKEKFKKDRTEYLDSRKKTIEECLKKTSQVNREYKELIFTKKDIEFQEKIQNYIDNLEQKALTFDAGQLEETKLEIQNLKLSYKEALTGSNWWGGNSHILDRLLYQFPGVLEKEVEEKVLSIPLEKITAFWPCMMTGVLSHLEREIDENTEEKYKDLGKKVLRKMYDVYKVDSSREQRELGGVYPGSGVVLTTSQDCLMSIESLGRDIGMNREQIYNFLGTSYEAIQKIEKDWKEGKRAKWEKETPISIRVG